METGGPYTPTQLSGVSSSKTSATGVYFEPMKTSNNERRHLLSSSNFYSTNFGYKHYFHWKIILYRCKFCIVLLCTLSLIFIAKICQLYVACVTALVILIFHFLVYVSVKYFIFEDAFISWQTPHRHNVLKGQCHEIDIFLKV